jgi:hypothetical protein
MAFTNCEGKTTKKETVFETLIFRQDTRSNLCNHKGNNVSYNVRLKANNRRHSHPFISLREL